MTALDTVSLMMGLLGALASGRAALLARPLAPDLYENLCRMATTLENFFGLVSKSVDRLAAVVESTGRGPKVDAQWTAATYDELKERQEALRRYGQTMREVKEAKDYVRQAARARLWMAVATLLIVASVVMQIVSLALRPAVSHPAQLRSSAVGASRRC